MSTFNFQLTSNESTFIYNFSENFLDKKYEIGLIKLDGYISNKKITSDRDENNNFIENKYFPENLNNIFLKCNLIEDFYINTSKTNYLFRIPLWEYDPDELITKEPYNIIFHKLIKRPNEIILKLVDINNNLINFPQINLFVELALREF